MGNITAIISQQGVSDFAHRSLRQRLAASGFFFVDYRFEISNLDLIRDMVGLIELVEDPF